MVAAVSGEAWFTLAVALVTIGLLAADRYSAVLVMGGALVTLFVAGVIDEDQAFGGFSNEAPITGAALYILTGAADATGALEGHITRVLGSGLDSGSARTGRVTSTTGWNTPAMSPASSRIGLNVNVKKASSEKPWRVRWKCVFVTSTTSPRSRTRCIHGRITG